MLELHSNRTNMTLTDRDYATMPVVPTSSSALRSPRWHLLPFYPHSCLIILWQYWSDWPRFHTFMCRDSARTITSLPVSPCSSPLRQYGTAHKSCYLSPPHPAYAMAAQGGYNFSEYSSYTMRPNTTYTLDPFHEASPYRAHTPGGSPRTRPIWMSVNTNKC